MEHDICPLRGGVVGRRCQRRITEATSARPDVARLGSSDGRAVQRMRDQEATLGCPGTETATRIKESDDGNQGSSLEPNRNVIPGLAPRFVSPECVRVLQCVPC